MVLAIFLVWFGLGWLWICSNYQSEASIEFSSLSTYFLLPYMSLRVRKGKPWFWLYFWFWFRFGLVYDILKSLIWGHHCILKLRCMPFDTQHVNVAQKLTKTIVLVIFLVLAWSGLVLMCVFVQILNLLSEPVPTIPHTPKSDLKCLRNSGELTSFHIQNLKCAQPAADTSLSVCCDAYLKTWQSINFMVMKIPLKRV